MTDAEGTQVRSAQHDPGQPFQCQGGAGRWLGHRWPVHDSRVTHLHSGALPLAAQGVLDLDVDLGAVKGAAALVHHVVPPLRCRERAGGGKEHGGGKKGSVKAEKQAGKQG